MFLLILLASFLFPTSIADVGVFVFHVHRGDSGSEYRKSFDEILSQVSGNSTKPNETSEFRAFPFHFVEYAEKRIEDLAFGLGKSLEALHPYYLPLGGSSPIAISANQATVYGVQPEISVQMRDLILGALHRSGFHVIEQEPAPANTFLEYPNLIIVATSNQTQRVPEWAAKRVGMTHVRLNQSFDIYRCKEHWADEKCIKIKTQCIGRSFC